MAYPTITEKHGSTRCSPLPKSAAGFLPMTDSTVDDDPGWFPPHLAAEAANALKAASLPAGDSAPAGPVPDPTEAP